MKYLCLMAFCLCACCCINPLSAQHWNKYQPHSIEILYGIEYGHRLLSSDASDPDVKNFIRSRNASERGKTNWRLGFNYNYMLTDRLFVKTGMRYVNSGYRTKKALGLSSAEQLILSESGLQKPSHKGYNLVYQMLEFPLALRYVYSEHWCKSYAEFGFSANHYLQTKLKGNNALGNSDQLIFEQNKRDWSLSTALAIGAEFLIQKRVPAFIQMTARYQLTKMAATLIEERLLAFGIETGIRYAF